MGTKLLTPEEGWWPSDTKWNHLGPWLVKLKFGALCAPPSSSSGWLMAFIHLIWAMFVYGFHCFFVCFIHHGTPTGSFPESFVKVFRI